MITKAEQCEIIMKHLNAAEITDDCLDGITDKYLEDVIMDALDEITIKNKTPNINCKAAAMIRNKNAEEARDFLFLLGGSFSFKQKNTGDFTVIDLEDETSFTLRIDNQNHICIDNYYIFHNDRDCMNTLRQICERGIKYNPNLAKNYKKHLSDLFAFE